MIKYLEIFVGLVTFLLLLSFFFRWLVLRQVRKILSRREPEVILIVDDVTSPSALMRAVKEWFKRQLCLEAIFASKFHPDEHGQALVVEEIDDTVYVQFHGVGTCREFRCPCHLGHCQVACLEALGRNAM